MTLVQLVRQWVAGDLTLSQVVASASTLEYPVRVESNGEYWYVGEQDNTFEAVQALIGSGITMEDYSEFVSAMS